MRAFIAIDIPEEVKAELRVVQKALAVNLEKGLRWVDPYSTHLTVKFLGEIDRGLISNLEERLEAAVENLEEVAVATDRLGVFPNSRSPRVLWIGLKGGDAQLDMLQRRVEEELNESGFLKEKRPFSPHLTLARVNESVSNEVIASLRRSIVDTPVKDVKFTMRTISLIERKLSPWGARYATIFTKRLK